MLFSAIDPWILAFSAVTVIATVFMGFWTAKKSKTASDFFVAGRSVSVGWNASAISGEYLSAASFMGIAGMVMSSGYDALWYPVCYACGYLFLLLFIAGPLRRFGAYTIPDFAEGRYDSPLFRKIAVVFVLFIGFFYTMPQMKGAGTTLAYIFPGLPYWAGVVLVGAVITLNVALGGMKGITLVQAFQYWAKMFAISVPIFVLMAVYGSYGRHLGATALNQRVSATTRQVNNPAGNQLFLLSPIPTNSQTVNLFGVYMRYLDSTAGGGQFPIALTNAQIRVSALRPFVTAGSEIIAKATQSDEARTQFHLAQKIAIERDLELNGFEIVELKGKDNPAKGEERTLILVANEIGRSRKFISEKAPADFSWLSPFGPLTTKAAKAAKLSAEDAKPYSLLYTYSLIIALVCGTAGLPHILVRFYTNPDGVAAKRTTMWVMILIGVFYVFPPVFGVMGRNLMPELYSGVGAKGTDKIVLELPRILNERSADSLVRANPDHANTPANPRPLADSAVRAPIPWGSILSGITCAGAFAAFMSTFSGLLVSMTGALAHDVYGRMLRPKSTPEQRMRMFRISAVILGAGAILAGTQVELLQINFMVGQAFAIAAASYFPLLFMSCWWRQMTMKGAATGMLVGGCSAMLAISLSSFSDLGWLKLADFWALHPLLRILCEQPAIWAVPLAITLMVIVSKLSAKDVPADIRMKMLVLHAPEKLGLKQEYIQEHQHGH